MHGRIEDMICSRRDCTGKAIIAYPLRHGFIGYACRQHMTDQLNTRRFKLRGDVLDYKKLERNLNAR